MRSIALIEAPTNLGLRPAPDGRIPGTDGAPAAIRAAGLLDGLDVTDGGLVAPQPYDRAWEPGADDRNADGIAVHALALAERLASLPRDALIVVLGGDCSVLIGEALALRREGRHGLVFIDGHGDFRHPGNSEAIVAAAGEDLAIVTGRGDPRLVDLDGRGPSIRDDDVVALGLRSDDVFIDEMRALGMDVRTADRLRADGIGATLTATLGRVAREDLAGFWIHIDVDVLDPSVMPAVDSPAPGGLEPDELVALVGGLIGHPDARGFDVCIYDPGLDADGQAGATLASTLKAVLATIGAPAT